MRDALLSVNKMVLLDVDPTEQFLQLVVTADLLYKLPHLLCNAQWIPTKGVREECLLTSEMFKRNGKKQHNNGARKATNIVQSGGGGGTTQSPQKVPEGNGYAPPAVTLQSYSHNPYGSKLVPQFFGSSSFS